MPATPVHLWEESQLEFVWHVPTSAMKAMTFLSCIPRGIFDVIVEMTSLGKWNASYLHATNNKSKSMQRRKVENDEKVKNENPKSPFDEKVQVNRTSACKRKHQDETEGFTEEGSCSGCRLREMKASVRSRTLQGAVFWPSAWRTKLCTCTDCKILYADAGVSFLMDEIDTVLAYEIKGKSTEQVEQAGGGDGHDPLISALNTLNRVQHLEIIHKYK
ncbi:putative E3 ubiquitin-protein ligase UBR7 isoform X2 [Xyrauchen texanus]|uniref:putative E3 ubiquitin-protein ligase UBR7 isoform X2 n=1 Tax=Xyrauchen texanus TaxID=154827 RepID=UPI0022421DD0|nr:putative E3 ubiquitin-protein ligase UBR7 isoform X2 [Xyrauchen texanus]